MSAPAAPGQCYYSELQRMDHQAAVPPPRRPWVCALAGARRSPWSRCARTVRLRATAASCMSVAYFICYTCQICTGAHVPAGNNDGSCRNVPDLSWSSSVCTTCQAPPPPLSTWACARSTPLAQAETASYHQLGRRAVVQRVDGDPLLRQLVHDGAMRLYECVGRCVLHRCTHRCQPTSRSHAPKP